MKIEFYLHLLRERRRGLINQISTIEKAALRQRHLMMLQAELAKLDQVLDTNSPGEQPTNKTTRSKRHFTPRSPLSSAAMPI